MATIYAFHLLNDYSGSPKVLGQLLRGWVRDGQRVHLHTSLTAPGFLSGIEGVAYSPNGYRFYESLPLRLLALFLSQLYTFLYVLIRVGRRDVVYVNTLLPFGAGVAGWLRGARVVYHIHETSVRPAIFKRFLLLWVRWCAREVIYVSDFLANEEPVGRPSRVIWNAVPVDFAARAAEYRRPERRVTEVLMIASLKRYKGVDELVAIAGVCPELQFTLVVNASIQQISDYFGGRELPANLAIYPAQTDVHPFYRRADIVMNLSRPDEWVETFGLTALEAMTYGLPVIVPPAGGIAEITPDGRVGFHLDGRDTAAVADKLGELSRRPDYYAAMSRAARRHAERFTEARLQRDVLAAVRGKESRKEKLFQNVEQVQ